MVHNGAEQFLEYASKCQSETLRKTGFFQVLLRNLRYEGKPRRGINIRQTRLALSFFRRLSARFRFEEKRLFPFLVRHVPKLGPAIRMLEGWHDEFREELKDFRKNFQDFIKAGPTDAEVCERLQRNGIYLVHLLQHEVQAERRFYAAIPDNFRMHETAKLEALLRNRAEGGGHGPL